MMPPMSSSGARMNTLVSMNDMFCICMTSLVSLVMSDAAPNFCVAAKDIACALRKRSARSFVPKS